MTNSDVQVFACDVCGSDDPAEIEVARLYTGNRPFHVCKACGLVYARERRSEQAVADTWSNELFQDTVDLRSYTAAIPWMIGRLTVVAEFLHQNIGLRGKVVAEIGAGEGVFPTIIRREPYGAEVFGIEPSSRNCKILRDLGIPTFEGTIGAYIESPEAATRQFDVVAMLWTLEASQSPRRMVEAARKMLKPGGYVVVGTGSRILVPFKKPLHMYLVEGPVDVHPVNLAISEFPKWRKYLILLSFLDNSSARPVQIGGVDVNICHSRVDRSPRTPAVQFAIPSAGAILSHTDGPCGS